MLEQEDIVQLVSNKNTRIHWSVKAFAVKSVSDESKLSPENLAYKLNLTLRTTLGYLKLAKAMKLYPNLRRVSEKGEALRLLKFFNDEPSILREQIQLNIIKHRTKLQQKEIQRNAELARQNRDDSEFA